MNTTDPQNSPRGSDAPPRGNHDSGNHDSGDHAPQSAHRAADSAPTADKDTPVRSATAGRTRLGSMWVSLIGMAVVLVVLLIFVLQNPTRTEIRFLWLDGQLPVGVALLFASIAGILLVAIPASGRIWQLRRGIRRNRTP